MTEGKNTCEDCTRRTRWYFLTLLAYASKNMMLSLKPLLQVIILAHQLIFWQICGGWMYSPKGNFLGKEKKGLNSQQYEVPDGCFQPRIFYWDEKRYLDVVPMCNIGCDNIRIHFQLSELIGNIKSSLLKFSHASFKS